MTRRACHRPTAPLLAAACALALAAAVPARGASFLDEVERGRGSVASAEAASLPGTAARAAAVDRVLRRDGAASPAFAIGALLAALDLDLASDPAHGAPGDRAIVERQVADLLRAQAESRIGNRALCLLSGRKEPRTLEAQIRLVEPGWSCGPRTHGAHH